MMKRLFMILAAAAATSALFSCSENIGGTAEDDDTGPKGPFTISADKTEIEADAKDAVTFTLRDADGNDLTASDPGGVYFKLVETGDYMDYLQRTYTSFDNGTYTFCGIYKGTETENTVTVTAVNRSKYEKFHRNVAVYKMTGTWCPNCPSMTAGLNGVVDDVKEHIVILACHGNSASQSDPYSLQVGGGLDLGNHMLSEFFGPSGGFPSLVLNLHDTFLQRSHSAIEGAVNEQRRDYPATCGIKVVSSCTDGNLKAEVTLQSDKGGRYDIECAVLLDNEIYAEGAEPGGLYNHIVRGYSGNFSGYTDANAQDVAAGGEVTKTFSIGSDTISELASKTDNCSIVVYAMRQLEDGTTMVDNIVSCPVNGSVDYVLNK